MIVRRFLLWARTASVAERADGVGALARAYLYSSLSVSDRRDAEAALTSLLDDPSPVVRRSLADALGSAMDTPRHIAVALANDQSDIAAIVLARSPVLGDADMIDIAAGGDVLAQTAIAIRPGLSASVSAALAEIGEIDAILALAGNHSADIPEFSLLRMIERHGEDGAVREALFGRPDLPVGVRQALAVALSRSLSAFAVGQGWLAKERGERITREARERATVALAVEDLDETPDLVTHLRKTEQLTPALILRALMSGAVEFVEAVFADLTDMPQSRVSALLNDRRGSGFSAIYRRSGLPGALAPAFRAAFAAVQERKSSGETSPHHLSRRIVERVIVACEGLPLEEAGKLMAMLRRFEAEAAREEARDMAERMADDAALETLLEIDPDALMLHGPADNDSLAARDEPAAGDPPFLDYPDLDEEDRRMREAGLMVA